MLNFTKRKLDMLIYPTGQAKIAGIIGYPVRHSRSPQLHSWWLKQYSIDGLYVPLNVPPEHLTEVIHALGKAGFRGVNITVPHKEAALNAVDKVTAIARRIGAVNTIVYSEDGYSTGTNTDGFGFIESLKSCHPCWGTDSGLAVILGAGGVARAIVASLIECGVPKLILTNRSRERAEKLAADLSGPIEVIDWCNRSNLLVGATLLVNATTLGMENKSSLEITLDHLPRGAIVADVVYLPEMTQLLVNAVARGNPVLSGINMLLHQARPGFSAWFGIEPTVTGELKRLLLKESE